MGHSTRRRRLRQIELLRTQFAQGDGLPFADTLSAERLERAMHDERATWREKTYTPILTLWAGEEWLTLDLMTSGGGGSLAGGVCLGHRETNFRNSHFPKIL